MIFTDFFDDWTREDFSQFIYNDDYIKVDPEYSGVRATKCAEYIAGMLSFDQNLSLLDYGSGEGLLSKNLADRGFRNTENYDPFSSPRKPDQKFDIVTAFEVIEHTTSPRETLDEIIGYLKPGGFALISQLITPIDIDRQKANWWYIAPRNGHITFYNYDTILEYAHKKGFQCAFMGGSFVLFPRDFSAATRKFLLQVKENPRVTKLIAPSGACSSPEWNDTDTTPHGERFRWTARSEVFFGDIAADCDSVFLEIPLIGAVSDDFIDNCILRVGNDHIRLHRYGNSLCALVKGDYTRKLPVTLVTPPPVQPSSLNGSGDQRFLGLAIAE
ncbi:class I SAM-dependent methyltransferase [Acetobacter sp.]|uniref:class I SAM-dependent methyltransferase n=1 Tax=Acetobacter sp. TaxID=440 RepID=UPI0025B879FE|nr:class I SAM-dependent methyltransferase [Acetobacter sp.]MCH4092544.1 class I SAM-dependent methyltransferase [Acetobacter sp.]MCI1299678.1 class I SAM-dependent methyltransferase [Acetobacter sp.]MCI1315442.1 class I SAM-dependent methyltransferase [Acetobacter sp.]